MSRYRTGGQPDVSLIPAAATRGARVFYYDPDGVKSEINERIPEILALPALDPAPSASVAAVAFAPLDGDDAGWSIDDLTRQTHLDFLDGSLGCRVFDLPGLSLMDHDAGDPFTDPIDLDLAFPVLPEQGNASVPPFDSPDDFVFASFPPSPKKARHQ